MNRIYLQQAIARLKKEQEFQEIFELYLKSIEPIILMHWYLFVVPDIIARLKEQHESADENTDRN